MADEESEIRRMAEIADAINAILDADPVGDTPAQGSPMARDETVNSENTITETVTPPDGIADNSLAANDAIVPDAATIGGNGDHNVADDLDAAIAAELERDGDHGADGHFGPVPDINFGAEAPTNNEIGREVRADSQLADLSLRMQDTLAEIRTGQLIHGANNQDMLAQMESARDTIIAAMRAQIEKLNQETAERKAAISEHLQQLESQNSLLRDEMEIKILQFEDELKQIQQKYFENAVTDSDRLDRYREFLKYLLSERGTKID